jgi:anti-anti-sigma regulatory factor
VEKEVRTVMKVTTEKHGAPPTLKVEGKLAGPWVNELEKTWQSITAEGRGREVVADLSDVTFIDAQGWDLLERMMESGAELEAHELLPRYVIGEIKSRLALR